MSHHIFRPLTTAAEKPASSMAFSRFSSTTSSLPRDAKRVLTFSSFMSDFVAPEVGVGEFSELNAGDLFVEPLTDRSHLAMVEELIRG